MATFRHSEVGRIRASFLHMFPSFALIFTASPLLISGPSMKILGSLLESCSGIPRIIITVMNLRVVSCFCIYLLDWERNTASSEIFLQIQWNSSVGDKVS